MVRILNVLGLCLAALALLPLLGNRASATPVSITNADFESPFNADGVISSGAVTGWSEFSLGAGGTSTHGNFNPGGGTGTFYAASDNSDPNGGVLPNMSGPNAGFIFTGGTLSYFQQSLTATLQPNTRYTLTAAVGVRDNGNTFGGYNVIFGTTGTPVLSFNQSTAAPGATGGFYDISTTFTTGAGNPQLGQAINIRLGKNSGGGTGASKYVDFDNVRLDAATDAIDITSLMQRQVVQRNVSNNATLPIAGTVLGGSTQVEARAVDFVTSTPVTAWTLIDNTIVGGAYSGTLNVDAGWYRIEVRGTDSGGVPITTSGVDRIGVGEVFITAGQSNSANHGSPRQSAADDRVSAYNLAGGNWQHAVDPQPGASGTGGSPWPQLGDLLASALDVPVGFISVGQGSTQVSQWLPGTTNYDNRLQDALTYLGPDGLRAVLWHQGESDSLAATSSATYASQLSSIIAQSSIDAGFDVPWGVALASYHPSASLANRAQVIAGQQAVIAGDPLVFEGAFTDDFHTLGYLSDAVHFNQQGLDEHALRWLTQIDATFFAEAESVPEPSTYALGMIGLLGLGLLAWRRKRQLWIEDLGFGGGGRKAFPTSDLETPLLPGTVG